jgi:NADH:ubiquinone oxidoreductase subunit 6 (subunit J)
MSASFLIIAVLILASALAAVLLPRPIHCGLCAAFSFLATGALFLYLDAAFIGLIQLIVYVGAVAVLILFTILLTRPQPEPGEPPPMLRPSFAGGALAALAAVSLMIVAAVFFKPAAAPETAATPVLALEKIGVALVTDQVIALLLVGLLLSAALIGAVILAAPETPEE